MDTDEDTGTTRIARRAYALWEQEGRPHGRDGEHWRLACAAIEAEDALLPPTTAAAGDSSPAAEAGKAPKPEPWEGF
jgi:hypothetical protein